VQLYHKVGEVVHICSTYSILYDSMEVIIFMASPTFITMICRDNVNVTVQNKVGSGDVIPMYQVKQKVIP